MAFILADADVDALKQVNIKGNPSGFTLNSDNLQFPPIITKDTKNANWHTTDAMSYEPIAFFKSANPRDLGLEFQWIIGGKWDPDKVHKTIDDVKKYFYTCYLGSSFQQYPIVEITKLYNIITQRTTWRLNSVNVVYSPELVNVNGKWYPLNVKLSMDLLSITKLKGDQGGDTPMQELNTLEDSPKPGWY
jgi:hypothetical protein